MTDSEDVYVETLQTHGIALSQEVQKIRQILKQPKSNWWKH